LGRDSTAGGKAGAACGCKAGTSLRAGQPLQAQPWPGQGARGREAGAHPAPGSAA
jgi:hypothetical protein